MMRRMGLLLLLGGVLLAVVAIPSSWAISGVRLDRTPNATLSSDASGATTLSGFGNNKTSMTTANYFKVGTITNAWIGQTITYTTTVDPNVSVSCKSYSGGTCTASGWSLNLCLSADSTLAGKSNCIGVGQEQQLVFSNSSGPSNPVAQTFTTFSVTPGSTLHLYAKGTITGATASAQLCGDTILSLTGTGSTSSLSLAHSSATPRRFVLSLGSAYTCQ